MTRGQTELVGVQLSSYSSSTSASCEKVEGRIVIVIIHIRLTF